MIAHALLSLLKHHPTLLSTKTLPVAANTRLCHKLRVPTRLNTGCDVGSAAQRHCSRPEKAARGSRAASMLPGPPSGGGGGGGGGGGVVLAACLLYLMYLLRNLRWKSLRTVSLMKRRASFLGSRAWFLNTTSSSHLRLTAKLPPPAAPTLVGSSSGLPCRIALSRSLRSVSASSVLLWPTLTVGPLPLPAPR